MSTPSVARHLGFLGRDLTLRILPAMPVDQTGSRLSYLLSILPKGRLEWHATARVAKHLISWVFGLLPNFMSETP